MGIGTLYQNRLGFYKPKARTGDRPFRVRVGVVDAREDCGRLRLLITPIAGSGEIWVNAEAVILDEEKGTGTHG